MLLEVGNLQVVEVISEVGHVISDVNLDVERLLLAFLGWCSTGRRRLWLGKRQSRIDRGIRRALVLFFALLVAFPVLVDWAFGQLRCMSWSWEAMMCLWVRLLVSHWVSSRMSSRMCSRMSLRMLLHTIAILVARSMMWVLHPIAGLVTLMWMLLWVVLPLTLMSHRVPLSMALWVMLPLTLMSLVMRSHLVIEWMMTYWLTVRLVSMRMMHWVTCGMILMWVINAVVVTSVEEISSSTVVVVRELIILSMLVVILVMLVVVHCWMRYWCIQVWLIKLLAVGWTLLVEVVVLVAVVCQVGAELLLLAKCLELLLRWSLTLSSESGCACVLMRVSEAQAWVVSCVVIHVLSEVLHDVLHGKVI